MMTGPSSTDDNIRHTILRHQINIDDHNNNNNNIADDDDDKTKQSQCTQQ